MAGEEEDEDDYMSMAFLEEPAGGGRGGKAGRGRTSHAAAPETSLQRRQRLKREGEIRGHPKSKEELAAEEEARREAALSTSMLEAAASGARKSKGLAMMAKMGFKAGDTLGAQTRPPPQSVTQQKHNPQGAEGTSPQSHADGGISNKNDDEDGKDNNSRNNNNKNGFVPSAITEPLRPEMRDGRAGIGLDADRKRKVREAAAQQEKRARTGEAEFRDRVRREREEARAERLAHGAMKVCEGMAEEEEEQEARRQRGGEDGDDSSDEDAGGTARRRRWGSKAAAAAAAARRPPLKSIPVEWRGLVRAREEAGRERRARHDMLQSSAAPRYLPRLAEDHEGVGDADDQAALGGGGGGGQDPSLLEETVVGAAGAGGDDDDEDPELEAFNGLEAGERLRRVVGHLRARFRYCFWCKCAYPDEEMDGCPGITEEEHD